MLGEIAVSGAGPALGEQLGCVRGKLNLNRAWTGSKKISDGEAARREGAESAGALAQQVWRLKEEVRGHRAGLSQLEQGMEGMPGRMGCSEGSHERDSWLQ